VVEVTPRTPIDEADAELPGRLGVAMELAGLDLQPAVQVVGKGKRRRLPDADDTHGCRSHDADLEVRQLDLERDGGEKTGTAAAEHEDSLDHGRSASGRTSEVTPRTVAVGPRHEAHI